MMNCGRFMCRTTDRMSTSGMPWRIFGKGSEIASIWVVVSSTCSALRTTTEPKSKGPATAGAMPTRLSGAPL
jgi:hypothetical protein